MRCFPAVATTWFRLSSATSATKSVPVTTCQIGPSSLINRLRNACANSWTSVVEEAAISSRSNAMVRSTSEPASTVVGSWTRKEVAEALPLAAGGAAEASAPPALASAASAAVSSAGAAALELAPGDAWGPSKPGDFQMTTEVSPMRQRPMEWSTFLQANPRLVPIRTCQCGSKLLSRDPFSARANAPQCAFWPRFLSSGPFLTMFW
mmetsp:Transcript_86276/g.229303  ORF Transcript_86276/g.229303 Transcript_86276/m.229303 type:complete len:207 (-) Transcript_86276:183-803(-)